MSEVLDVGPLGSRDEVHLWLLDTPPEAVQGSARLLSADELERAGRFRFARDRARFINRRTQVRLLLGAYLSCDPATIRFSVTGAGKPSIASPESDVHFNVSQSADVGACIVGRCAGLGVDVERVRRDVVEALAPRICTDREWSALARLGTVEREVGFFTLWTHKEALLKAEGRGLSFDVATIDVADALIYGTAQTRLLGPTPHSAYYSQTVFIGVDDACAVASAAPDLMVIARQFTAPER